MDGNKGRASSTRKQYLHKENHVSLSRDERREIRSDVGFFGRLTMWWAVVALVFSLAIGAVGWQVGWWFKTQNVNRQSHLIRHSYGYQQTLRDQITAKIGDVLTISTQIADLPTGDSSVAPLKAQRKAIAAIVCQDADEVAGDPLPVDQQQFVQANCLDGNVSLTSQYN